MKTDGKHFDTAEISLDRRADAGKRRLKKKRERRQRQRKVPRWVYRVIAILVAAVIGLLVWFNKDNLSPQKIADWIQESVVGMGIGDGFPCALGDNFQVQAGNFRSSDKEAVLVSDTALYVFNSTAKELVDRQHSFGRPVLKTEGSQVLIYNQGAVGYRLEGRAKTLRTGTADGKIFCGAVAANGRYALVTAEDGYCAKLTVYDAGGDKLFEYWFADYYPTAAALSSDGGKVAVTAASASDGGLVSTLYLLDIGVKYDKGAEPIAQYQDNLLINVFYGRNGTVSAIGDKLTVLLDVSSKKTTEYNYNGKQLLAYTADSGRTALSLAPYQNSANNSFVVLDSKGKEVIRQELSAQTKSISIFGDTAAVLAGGGIHAYSILTGSAMGELDAGQDASVIALCDESRAYVLGISELRMVAFG